MLSKKSSSIIITIFISTFSIINSANASTLGFDTSTPCNYWKDVFDFGMSAAGILTLVMLVVGGLYYIVSMGEEERLGNAKAMMGGALVGFVLAIFSWMIFKVISPSLLSCRIDVPEVVQPELTLDTSGGGGAVGPNGAADPCAGVADEDLFDTQELCESGGGDDGECDGMCLEIPPIPAESNEDDNEEGGSDEDGDNSGDDSTGDEEGDDSGEEGESALGNEEESPSLTNTDRAGKFCCAGGGSCNDVLRYIEEGRISARGSNIQRDLPIGMRECRWTMRSPCRDTNACDVGGFSREVPIDERLCTLLINLVDVGGLHPTITNLVRGHGRCRRCQWPDRDNPCNRDSSHWHGKGMDLEPNPDIQRWIAENSSGLASLYGPLGMPASERGKAESEEPCLPDDQRYSSEFFINMGRRPGSLSGRTICTHRRHIHLDYDF